MTSSKLAGDDAEVGTGRDREKKIQDDLFEKREMNQGR